MRFVLAIVCFVIAAGLIGLGIAQRTILAAPDEAVLTTSAASPAPVTVVDGSAMNAYDGTQRLAVSGSDPLVGAYGRTTDVLGWVGDADYNLVTFDADADRLVTELVRGEESEVPSPLGSDLWLAEYEREDALALTVNIPADFSFILVSDGVAPAPSDVTISWPVDNSTPWSGPLIVSGAVVLLVGLAFLLWATTHLRRSRGPRRKSQKMPKLPKRPNYKPMRKGVERPVAGRRSIGWGMIALPALLAGGLILSGCAGAQADFAAVSTPTPSGTAVPSEAELDPPAVTVKQAERIVAQVSETVAAADAAKDTALLETRMGGAALELRLANYAIHTADATITGLPAIPAGPVTLILPQQTESWPRTVFAVIQDETDATIPPVALFLEQADPRANYRATYAITLEPSAVLPDVAPANVGASRLTPDSPVLRSSPTELALAYADILERDVESDAYLNFDPEGDSLRAAVGLAKKQEVRASLPTTASVEFGHEIGPAEAIVMATNDAGSLIAVNLYETTTVAPVEEGAAVNPSGQVKALSGLAVSTTGVVATYSDQLLFYAPDPSGDGKIVLLGYSQGLVKASEIG